VDPDSDDDGWLDGEEPLTDLDGDGRIDPLDPDDDGDGVPTASEAAGDVDGDGTPNYLDRDSDGDGAVDGVDGGPYDAGGAPSTEPASATYGFGCASAPGCPWWLAAGLVRRRRSR
jgi:hypothetical protein